MCVVAVIHQSLCYCFQTRATYFQPNPLSLLHLLSVFLGGLNYVSNFGNVCLNVYSEQIWNQPFMAWVSCVVPSFHLSI